MNRKFLIPFVCLVIAINISIGITESTNQQKTAQTAEIRRVEVEAFSKALTEQGSVLLDVRTARELESGHIKNAINLDFHASDFETMVPKLDKSKNYLIYCAGGARSALACKKMKQMGFSKLIDLAPGFSGWKQAKKPVEI